MKNKPDKKITLSDLPSRAVTIARRILKGAGDRPFVQRNEYGYGNSNGPVCALGAGILWKSKGKPVASFGDEKTRFAEDHGVTESYAYGIEDGFEDYPNRESFCGRRKWSSPGNGSRQDYREGRKLGMYIAQRAQSMVKDQD